MKASANQILIAASNILAGSVITDSNMDTLIDTAIKTALRLAARIPNTEDIFDDPSKIKEIIVKAYDKLGSSNASSSLLQETIRINEATNRQVAVAYMQRATSLGIITPITKKGTRTITYFLNKNGVPKTATP